MNYSSTRCAAVVLACLLLAGCATNGDLEALQQRVVSLEQYREKNEVSMQEDVARLEKLHKMLREAELTLRKSGANLGSRVESLEAQTAATKGDLDTTKVQLQQANHYLDVMKREMGDRFGIQSVFLPPDIPKDAPSMFKAAQSRATAGKNAEARAVYALYAANFRSDPKAPQALNEIGKLMEKDGNIDGAIAAYQKVYDTFPDAIISGQAVLRIGELYVARSECERARDIYRFVASEFDGREESIIAKERARTVMTECN